jgi:two-component system CitB family response regulator
MVRNINAEFLKKIDSYFEIFQAANIKEAKECIQNNNVDFVLLDVYLGDESGPDLLKWIRGEGLDIDVVLITADNSAQTVETVFRFGAVDYLIKPYEYERFKQAIINVLSRRQIKHDTHVSQEKLDDIINPKSIKEVTPEKGVNQATYKLVEEVVKNSKVPLTAQEIASQVHLARVTVRRYLEYMLEEALLTETYNYGKVGRPQKTYQWIKENR